MLMLMRPAQERRPDTSIVPTAVLIAAFFIKTQNRHQPVLDNCRDRLPDEMRRSGALMTEGHR